MLPNGGIFFLTARSLSSVTVLGVHPLFGPHARRPFPRSTINDIMTSPTLLTLPLEVRLKIYDQLFKREKHEVWSELASGRTIMIFDNVGPIALHRNLSITAPALLTTCKRLHAELTSHFHRRLSVTLYIFIVLNLPRALNIRPREMEDTLAALSQSPQYSHIRTAVIDIRIIQGSDIPPEEGGVPRNLGSGGYNFSSNFAPLIADTLEKTNRAIASTLTSLSPTLRNIEVAWICYVRGHASGAIERTLKVFEEQGLVVTFVERPVFYGSLKGISGTCKSIEREWPGHMRAWRQLDL